MLLFRAMECNLDAERRLWLNGFRRVAGIDEVGRGPLAGPVVAAAVILSDDFDLPGLDDSKKLAPQIREQFFNILTAPGSGVLFGVGAADPGEIDRVNILQATYLAMWRAVLALPVSPEYLLIDGRPVPRFQQPQQAIVGGDGISQSIAAASIIAKVTRDSLMTTWHQEFPLYAFDRNKGYGTRSHLERLQAHGPCPIHRKSFAPVAQTTFQFF
jgi:ribonuclease HII